MPARGHRELRVTAWGRGECATPSSGVTPQRDANCGDAHADPLPVVPESSGLAPVRHDAAAGRLISVAFQAQAGTALAPHATALRRGPNRLIGAVATSGVNGT